MLSALGCSIGGVSNPGQFGDPEVPVLGAMRYERKPDGRLVETAPTVCPQGHDLTAQGTVQVGFHHGHGMREYHCVRCHAEGVQPAAWCLHG